MENDAQLKAGGANHTLEHAYLFPFQGKYQPTAADVVVQRALVGYWTRMARNGNPNGGSDAAWPRATPDNDAYLEIGAATAARQGSGFAKCDFWDNVQVSWPHL
jgi:para-nitrobenzyl esterase